MIKANVAWPVCCDEPSLTLKSKRCCTGQGYGEAGHDDKSIFKTCFHYLGLKYTMDFYRCLAERYALNNFMFLLMYVFSPWEAVGCS